MFYRVKIHYFSLLLASDSQRRTNTKTQNFKAQSLDPHINPQFLRKGKTLQLLNTVRGKTKETSVLHKL